MRTREGILVDTLGNYYSSGKEMLFHCPFCDHHKKKLSVNIEKNVYKCWVCDSSGSDLANIINRFADFQARQEWTVLSGQVEISSFEDFFHPGEQKVQTTVVLPKEYISLANANLGSSAKPAMAYLEKRGVTQSDILKWKIGYCDAGEYHGRIVFPSFDESGHVNYYVTRTYVGAWPKYKNSKTSRDIVFNELYVDWGDDLVLTEGVFDAIKSPNSIPLLGSTMRQGSKIFERIVESGQKVFLAFDEDASKKEYQVISFLLSYGVETYKVDTTGVEDVGAMTKQEFSKRKEKASLVSYENYLVKSLFTF